MTYKRANYAVIMESTNEYIVRAYDPHEAACMSDQLADLMDEKLKDIKPLWKNPIFLTIGKHTRTHHLNGSNL